MNYFVNNIGNTSLLGFDVPQSVHTSKPKRRLKLVKVSTVKIK